MKKLTLLLSLVIGLASGSLSAAEVLRMSTTTSTQDSGLLGVLNPVFEKKYDVRLDVIATGSGKALKLGENGDVDVLLVHAPKAEQEFVDAGFGVDRKAVMHNDFIVLGAKDDVAQVKGSNSAAAAFTKISAASAPFVSRGDDSGTHKKELAIWETAKLKPEGSWYIVAGQGMGEVLKMADEKQAYTLSDRGTYLSYQGKIQLGIVFEGGKELANPYHVIAVNPAKYPQVKYELAKKYIDFLTSEEGQKIIADFKQNGQQLFYPDALTAN